MSDAKTVIVAEDDETTRTLFVSLLKTTGWTVAAEAANGKEAVEAFKTHRPGLTLLDIQMPEMDGVEALKRIKTEDPNATVVMLTGISNMDVIEDCIAAGAKDYLRKDLNPLEIRDRLDDILG